MTAYQPDGRSRTLRRQAEEARRAAVEGRWEDAVKLNRAILEHAPRDVDAHNRLGKALMELGRIAEAIQAYREALNLDPGNVIAQRNLERLEKAAPDGPPPQTPAAIQARVFIEEVGKTYVTDLVRPGPAAVRNRVTPADEVELRREGQTVHVYTMDGQRLGQLEPRIAMRLLTLLDAGNRYQAYVVAVNDDTVRIILRETYRDPNAPEHLAFPRQAKMPPPRPYIRDTGRAARELAPDLLLDADEEEEEELGEEEPEETEALVPELDEAEEEDDFLVAAPDEEDDVPLAE
ncbi:MAG: tetratricopeptide repeat protein [Sphaerobacter sp.]|nr:tetratricopeptide repeat protein [Sphaerobacter sp.]